MNDKTLLELAARAAGYVWRSRSEITHDGLWIDGVSTYWNPLSDDGQALYLAVKLRIDFYIGDDSGEAAYAGYYKSDAGDLHQRFMIQRFADSPSPCAATRRAIVRAAAAIAEQGEKE